MEYGQKSHEILQTILPSNNVFDENSFEFKLLGGPLHSQVLIANATMRKGENQGMPVPLYCTWYNVSMDSNQFTLIEHVTGACFQPSIDDVGMRICVHAIPASDAEEYQGMPMFAEVGPIILDEKTTQSVSQLLSQDEFTLNIMLNKISSQSLLETQDLKIPCKGQLRTSKRNIVFENQHQQQLRIDLDDLQINIVKHVNNKVELTRNNEQLVTMTMNNNVDRDVFVMTCRQLIQDYADNKQLQQSEQIIAQSVIIDELNTNQQEEIQQQESNEIEKADTSNSKELQIRISELEQKIQFQKEQIDNYEQLKLEQENQIKQFRHSYAKKLEENKQNEDTIQKLKQELNFFRQEASLYQKENLKITKNMGKLQAKLELMTSQSQGSTSELSLREEFFPTKDENTQTEDVIQGESYQQLQSSLKELEQERDKLIGEKNYLKKKLTSITNDNERLQKQIVKLEQQSSCQQISTKNDTLDISYSSDLQQLLPQNRLEISKTKSYNYKPQRQQSITNQASQIQVIDQKQYNKEEILQYQKEEDQNKTISLDEEEDNLLVNDFIKKVSTSILQGEIIPEERLAALIEENAQMKIDIEVNLQKIKHYKSIIDDYKKALEDESKKSNQYRTLISQKSQSFTFGQSKTVEQLQKLVSNLTIMLGEKDDEIGVQKNINLELTRKLKELTCNS